VTKISIVIPSFEEDEELNELLRFISKNTSQENIEEILVVDYNNSSTIRVDGITHLQSPEKGRSKQLSLGGQLAKGDILYFLHADSRPPVGFDALIKERLNPHERAGCFRMNFDDNHLFLKFFAWFTRFNSNLCRGGDQSLFVYRNLYNEIGGYDDKLLIMEDLEIIEKLNKKTKFAVIQQEIITSARKYRQNGMYYLQWRFFILHLKYKLGHSQLQLISYYKKHIR